MDNRLFVAGLPFSTTNEELKSLFEQVGTVVSTNIITDRETNRSRGFGFVEMETAELATAAIAKFHESDYGGRKIIVNIAKPQEKKEFNRNDNRSGGFGNKKSFGRREGGRGNFGRDDNRRGGGSRW